MHMIDTATLIASGRALALPATLELRVDHSVGDVRQTLELLSLFRVVPHRRVVALARWQSQLVVVKLFFARGRWMQHLEREVQGVNALQQAGLPTAPMLARGRTTDGHCGVLLLHYIDQAQELGRAWEATQGEQRESLLRRIVSVIADCHERGLVQKDIHLNNFLLRNDAVYVLDAGELDQHSAHAEGVDGVSSLRNLALFLAQFPVSNDVHVPALYAHYRAQRPGADLSEEISVFRALLHKKRLLRLKTVMKKLFRDTSATTLRRRWNGVVVYDRTLESPALQALLQDPDEVIARSELLKDGNSATVALISLDGTPYVLKRYNLKSVGHRLRRLLQPSRAWGCWRSAHMLAMLGIATPTPRLMMERRIGPLRREAYFLSDYVAGEDALQLLKNAPITSPAWESAMAQFQALFTAFRDYHIVHGDTKASNFLLTESALVVLDLDGMSQETDTGRFARAHAKDLQRFSKNWEDSPERAARVETMLQRLKEESDYFSKGS